MSQLVVAANSCIACEKPATRRSVLGAICTRCAPTVHEVPDSLGRDRAVVSWDPEVLERIKANRPRRRIRLVPGED